MTSITINIPNHEVRFFKKMVSRMGWEYHDTDVVRTPVSAKERTLAEIDHALGQLQQIKEGKLKSISAEELFVNSPQEMA